MAQSKGRCPDCQGSGRKPRPPDADGKVNPFPQLCPRCQGWGIADLTGTERDAEFYRRGNEGQQAAERRGGGPGNPNRPFRTGMDPDEIRGRRDEIRRSEGRVPPPCEPGPDHSVTDSVTEPATDSVTETCPCGAAPGQCNGMCLD